MRLLISLAVLTALVHADPMDLTMLKLDAVKAVTGICSDRCVGKIGTCAEEWPSWDLRELTALAQKEVGAEPRVKMRSLKVEEENNLCIGLIEVSESEHGGAIFRVTYDLFGALGAKGNITATQASEADARAAEEVRKAALPKYRAAKAESAKKKSARAEPAEPMVKKRKRKWDPAVDREPPRPPSAKVKSHEEFMKVLEGYKLPKIPPANTSLKSDEK